MHDKPNVRKADFAKEAKIFMESVNDYEGKGAKTKLIKYIRGSNAAEIWERYKANKNWGIGKNKPVAFWNDLCASLISEGYIGEGSQTNAAGWSYSVLVVEIKSGVDILHLCHQ